VTRRMRTSPSVLMEKSGLALIGASALASLLGFLFWALAARWFTPAEVGTATAAVAAMVFLANLATFGLRNGILRFAARREGYRFVRRVYVVCALCALLVALVFLAGRSIWATGLTDYFDNPWVAASFVLATAAWVLFVLQDSALTASGRAHVVPIVQGGYGAVKIALLAIGAAAAVPGVVFLAYTLPTVAIVAVVSVAILRRSASATSSGGTEPAFPALGQLVRFAGAEHASALVWLAAVNLLPLLVLERAGADANAYYYIAFMTAYTLYLVTSNLGSALLVAGSREPARLPELARRTLRNAMALVLIGVIGGTLLAPWFLGLLGPGYAEHVGLLQLLLLSAIPQVIVGVSAAVARVRRSLAALAAQQIAVSALVIVGADLALRTIGLQGVGWAWLVAQTLVAVAVLLTTLRGIWLGGVPLGVLAWLDRRRSTLTRWRRARAVRAAAARLREMSGSTITDLSLLSSDNRMLVIGARMDAAPVVIRVAEDASHRVAAGRTADFLEAMARDDRLGALKDLLPEVRGRYDADALIVERRLPGAAPSANGPRSVAWVGGAVRAIAQLQRATAEYASGVEVTRLIRDDVARLTAALGPGERTDRFADIRQQVLGDIEEHAMRIGIRHGDCWAGNLLVDDADPARLTGLIDWEDARHFGLPDIDLAHLWLTTGEDEIGVQLVRALDAPHEFDAWLTDLGVARLNPAVNARTVIILAWVEHVVGGISRSRRGLTATWMARNVDAPLRALSAHRTRTGGRR
jgi:O-antigen/teichoic acid export membrane protein